MHLFERIAPMFKELDDEALFDMAPFSRLAGGHRFDQTEKIARIGALPWSDSQVACLVRLNYPERRRNHERRLISSTDSIARSFLAR